MFDGLEISDRELMQLKPSTSTISELRRKSIRNECGIILNINLGLTLHDNKALLNEISHAKGMLQAAHEVGSDPCRISWGARLSV